MRPLASLLVLLAVACTRSPQAVGESPPLPNAVGIETGSALETARAFVEAYEDPSSAAAALRRLVAGTDLQEWVRAVGIQNAGLEFLPRSDVQVTGLRVVELEFPTATVAVEAVVDTWFRSGDDVARSERRFDGLLLQRLDDGWKVVDAIQDTRRMQPAITVFDPPVQVPGETLVVAVKSLFRFEAGTVVNVDLQNRGEQPLRVSLGRSLLIVGGQQVPAEAMTGSLFAPLEAGERITGGMTFPAIEEETFPQAVVLRLAGARPIDVMVELPEEAFLLEGSDQSVSNSGAGGASGV